MKILKVLLFIFSWLSFSFIFIFLGIGLSRSIEKKYNDTQEYEMATITLNVWTWDRKVNLMPTLETISLSFLQFGNNSSISFPFEDCSRRSNFILRVDAINPIDPDGNISRLKFYYYNTEKPEMREHREILPFWSYTYFAIPRISWEYKFWVILFDNDWWVVDSKDIIWQPSIYIPWTEKCWETE